MAVQMEVQIILGEMCKHGFISFASFDLRGIK